MIQSKTFQNLSQQDNKDLSLITVNKARTLLKVRRNSVLRLIENGELNSKKIGNKIYIPFCSILNYLNDSKIHTVQTDYLKTLKSKIIK